MHESYENDDDDDDYDDDYDKCDYQKDNYKWYYKFDIGYNTPISNWINDIVSDFMGPLEENKTDKWWGSINNIPGFPFKKFPVSSWNPNTGNNKFQYLGSNYANLPIWKTVYFLFDKINTEYKLHLQANAKHFIEQPHYYKGMFDILN